MTTLIPRTALQPVSDAHWSSYRTNGKRHRLIEIVGGALAPAAMNVAMLALTADLWSSYGSPLYTTTLVRSREDQRKAWEADPNKAVEPGYSIHESGNAIDADMGVVNAEQFAVSATKVGLTPISNEPWHWQLLGHWARLYNRGPTGPRECAMAMNLDQGRGGYEGRENYGNDEDAALQAQIWRTYGPGCGAVDGLRGSNTKAALRAMGLPEDAGYQDLYSRCSVV